MNDPASHRTRHQDTAPPFVVRAHHVESRADRVFVPESEDELFRDPFERPGESSR